MQVLLSQNLQTTQRVVRQASILSDNQPDPPVFLCVLVFRACAVRYQNMACKYTKTLKNAIATHKHYDIKVSEATKAFSAQKGTLHDHIEEVYSNCGAATLTSKDHNRHIKIKPVWH